MSAFRASHPWVGNRPLLIAVAFLAGVLLLAPLVCGTHLPFHDQMGRSHGLCIFVITLAVGMAVTIPLLNKLAITPILALDLTATPLFDPIFKPPQ